MANIISTQILQNGHKNYVLKVAGILDTADIGLSDLIDTTAAGFTTGPCPEGPPTGLAIDKVEFDIEDTLAVNLFWDATADVLALSLVGRGCLEYVTPMFNNSGAGKTGKLLYSTAGWAASGVLSFNFTLYCRKTYS